MIASIKALGNETVDIVVEDAQQFVCTIMGMQLENTTFQSMIDIWLISGVCISAMYIRAIVGRS